MTRLIVATPCYAGSVTNSYTLSLLRLQEACLKRGIDFGAMLLGGDALISRARQNLVAHFLNDAEATHLLFVDADIAFAPEQAFRLLDSAFEISAAAYPTKRLHDGGLQYVVRWYEPEEQREGFRRAYYAGTGFLMICRSALQKMMIRHPELRYTGEHQSADPLHGSPYRYALFQCMLDNGVYLSEDFSFCKRWTDMGGDIWVDGDSQLEHIGSFSYRGNLKAIIG